MATDALTSKQKEFLDECLVEFSDRYTDSDLEYKKRWDEGIPPPPIMYPWHGRPKMVAHRFRERRNDGGRYRREQRDDGHHHQRRGYHNDEYEENGGGRSYDRRRFN